MSNLASLEESTVGNRGELTALVGVKNQSDPLVSGGFGEGFLDGLDD